MNITIPAQALAVIRLFAADDKDIRKYLHGVCLELGATESRLVATNGRTMAAWRLHAGVPGLEKPLGIIIPLPLIEKLKFKKDSTVDILVGGNQTDAQGSTSRAITLTYDYDVSVTGKAYDGVFPNWRRVIPTGVTGEVAFFDLANITLLHKVWVLLHGKRPAAVGLGYNGDGCLVPNLDCPDLLVLVMPMQTHACTPVTPAPSWAAKPLPLADDGADLV